MCHFALGGGHSVLPRLCFSPQPSASEAERSAYPRPLDAPWINAALCRCSLCLGSGSPLQPPVSRPFPLRAAPSPPTRKHVFKGNDKGPLSPRLTPFQAKEFIYLKIIIIKAGSDKANTQAPRASVCQAVHVHP